MKVLPPFLLSLLLLAGSLAAADTVELKQRWISGKKYSFTMVMAQQSTITMGAQKMEQQMTMTNEMSMVARAHEDRQRQRLTFTQDRIAMDMTMNGQKLGYDSAKPGGSDPLNMGKMMGAVVGKEIRILTDAAGEPVEVENHDEFIKSLPASTVPGLDFAKMYSKESLLHSMKQVALSSTPGKAIAAGETWPFSKNIEMAQVGKFSVKGTYTFKGLVDREGTRCAEVQTDGAMTADFAGGPAGAMMTMTEGTLKGPVWFDPALGVARESQIVQTMKMSMKNPVDPAAAPIEVPMTQTITTKLTKFEDAK